MPGQRDTGPVPLAAVAPGSWTGCRQECQECRAAVSFPLLLPPTPLQEQDIPCPGKPESSPFMGKPQSMWWALLLPWGGHSVQGSLGVWHRWGGHSRSVQVRYVLRTYYVLSASRVSTHLISQQSWEILVHRSGNRGSEWPGNMPEGTSWQMAEPDLNQARLILRPLLLATKPGGLISPVATAGHLLGSPHDTCRGWRACYREAAPSCWQLVCFAAGKGSRWEVCLSSTGARGSALAAPWLFL